MTREIPLRLSNSALIEVVGEVEQASTFPGEFLPNPGGQQAFFDAIGLSRTHSEYSGRFLYLRGGVGAGKTMCGSAFICLRSIQDQAARSLITANTYGQLETSTIPGFVEFCWRHAIQISPARATVEETAKAITARRLCSISIRSGTETYKSSVLVLSAENFTARSADARTPGAGLQVRSIWADEYSTAAKSAFDILNDRLGRGEGTIKGLGVITSTINKYNPYNWTYDLFDDADRDTTKKELFRSITVKTTENTTLDSDYYESVAAGLTEEHRRIQLESEYVAVTEGRLISTFRREIHVVKTEPVEKTVPLHLTFDFNASPATATAWQVRDGEIEGCHEWFIPNSDTFELGQAVADWIVAIEHKSEVLIYGDASGGQKTANSKNTNWQIIRDSLTRQGLAFTMRVPKANPSIVDSVNGLKVRFAANKVYIADCQKELLKDLESVRWDSKKPGQIDKSDAMRSHLLDGLRYLAWVLYPYRGADRILSDKQQREKARRAIDRVY